MSAIDPAGVGRAVADALRAHHALHAQLISEAIDTLARRSAGLILAMNQAAPIDPVAADALETWVAEARVELAYVIAEALSPTAPSSHPGGAT